MPSIAIYVTWKQLGFFILLTSRVAERSEGAVRGRVHGRRVVVAQAQVSHHPGVRTVTTLITLLAIIVGANLFTEPYLLTAGGGPNGKSASPVLLMYQTGIEQNHPDFASALGIVLVIGALLIVGVQRLLQRNQT